VCVVCMSLRVGNSDTVTKFYLLASDDSDLRESGATQQTTEQPSHLQGMTQEHIHFALSHTGSPSSHWVIHRLFYLHLVLREYEFPGSHILPAHVCEDRKYSSVSTSFCGQCALEVDQL
jgi:hypothetical protein